MARVFPSVRSGFYGKTFHLVPSAGASKSRKKSVFSSATKLMSDYSLPGVLHFLQSEWRKFESLKNEWSIEKSDLQAQIVVLNGQKSNLEIRNADLQKRIKMLEYALKKERYKTCE
jgi:hypothetical protein